MTRLLLFVGLSVVAVGTVVTWLTVLRHHLCGPYAVSNMPPTPSPREIYPGAFPPGRRVVK